MVRWIPFRSVAPVPSLDTAHRSRPIDPPTLSLAASWCPGASSWGGSVGVMTNGSTGRQLDRGGLSLLEGSR